MEPIWKLSGPPAPERMMAGRATEPVSTFPTLLHCCCSTVDLRTGGQRGHHQSGTASRETLEMPVLTAHAHTHAHAHLLFRRHGIFQHGGLLISLQTKVVFALFLWKNHSTVSNARSRDTVSLMGWKAPEGNPPPVLHTCPSSSPPLYCYTDLNDDSQRSIWSFMDLQQATTVQSPESSAEDSEQNRRSCVVANAAQIFSGCPQRSP